MPKRLSSKSTQHSKKARNSVNTPIKRTSMPRNCKNTQKKKSIVDFNFLSMSCNKTVMGANQVKISAKEKDKKKEKEEVASLSSDELDVVFDLQEEKKNKVYEVITVMSDDETPNEVTYERIYADEPEKRIVEKSEIVDNTIDINILNDSDIVTEVVKEVGSLKENVEALKTENNFVGKRLENCESVNIDKKCDSDNEVICVAVLDAKTKAEQKKASIEEICLSSDSETESRPTVPPLRLQLPIPNFPYVNKYLINNGNDDSFGSNVSQFSYGYRQTRLYPYVYKHKKAEQLNSVSDLESCSTSPKATSSDECSPTPTNSPKVLSGEESSSSDLSDLNQPQHNLSPSENSMSPSSSSDDEEKNIYWKADRELRRKGELRYEEFTELGTKIHEGEVNIKENKTFVFKVMSYNVLAQNLLEQHMYLYKNHDRRALGWARRWSLLYNEIKDENPEILCLQEVEQSHLITHYTKLLDLGYRWVYKKRTSNYQDGVAVFYKAALFENEAHSLVEFYQPGVSVLDRDNVGVVIRLRLKESPNHAIVIATTHLLYNPRRGDVKLAQMQVLLAEIDRLAYNKDALTYYPIILTGDFNLKPRNGVYKLLTEGQLTYEGMSRKTLRSPEDHNTLPRSLLPCRLGITDRCQHMGVVEARVRGEDATKTKLYHSEDNRDPQQDINYNEDCSKDDRFESGTLRHVFNFQSVYPHTQPDGRREASTHHDNWVTVDYIFYSTSKGKECQKEDGSLQLLSRLRLPTQDECDNYLRHLPNFAFGSDHLPLVGKFLLRLR